VLAIGSLPLTAMGISTWPVAIPGRLRFLPLGSTCSNWLAVRAATTAIRRIDAKRRLRPKARVLRVVANATSFIA
jgi:hypothetical protein